MGALSACYLHPVASVAELDQPHLMSPRRNQHLEHGDGRQVGSETQSVPSPPCITPGEQLFSFRTCKRKLIHMEESTENRPVLAPNVGPSRESGKAKIADLLQPRGQH